jgi:hypothetical protein
LRCSEALLPAAAEGGAMADLKGAIAMYDGPRDLLKALASS